MRQLFAVWDWCFDERREQLYRDCSTFLLRLWFGGAMLVSHGWGKIARFQEDPSAFRDPIGLGSELSLLLVIFAEVICAALVVLGLATRLALLPLIFTMIIAGFVVNWFHLSATSYLVAYLVLLMLGPGRWSLDFFIARKRGSLPFD
ncbi:MAG: DoxX family protein [Planctomycetota bacterium]|nr:MAG: DoxX family protein [Planctomycetota bacterium]